MKAIMIHNATTNRGIIGLDAKRGSPRAAIMAQGRAVKRRSPREGVA
jgi:hypothetical protein